MALWAAVPLLSVNDLRAALEHYERVLGFSRNWIWGIRRSSRACAATAWS